MSSSFTFRSHSWHVSAVAFAAAMQLGTSTARAEGAHRRPRAAASRAIVEATELATAGHHSTAALITHRHAARLTRALAGRPRLQHDAFEPQLESTPVFTSEEERDATIAEALQAHVHTAFHLFDSARRNEERGEYAIARRERLAARLSLKAAGSLRDSEPASRVANAHVYAVRAERALSRLSPRSPHDTISVLNNEERSILHQMVLAITEPSGTTRRVERGGVAVTFRSGSLQAEGAPSEKLSSALRVLNTVLQRSRDRSLPVLDHRRLRFILRSAGWRELATDEASLEALLALRDVVVD